MEEAIQFEPLPAERVEYSPPPQQEGKNRGWLGIALIRLLSLAIVGAAVTVTALTAKAADGAISAQKAKKRAEDARNELDKQQNMFAQLDTSNPYLGMENTMEDLTVNQQAADFTKQQQMQSQQMAAQVALQKIEAEAQAKIQYRQADIAFELEKLKGEANLKAQLMQQEFNYNLQLQGMTQSQISQREQDKEKAKADRISQQNTQQSELITQRKNNLPPKKFESNEDTLDGFDLAEYEPR